MKYGKAVTIYAAYVLVFSTVINLVPTTIADAIENELNNNEGWWNDDWAFRKQITITEPIQGYQMEIMLAKNFNTEIRQDCVINCGNKCNPDFSDLRFIDEHNQLIPYWIAYIEDNIASFWLNLTSSDTIDVYYGNKDAETLSDGDSVWYWYDDFNDGQLNCSKWDWKTDWYNSDVVETNGLLTISAKSYSYISLGGGRQRTCCWSKETFPIESRLVGRVNIEDTSEKYWDKHWGFGSGSNGGASYGAYLDFWEWHPDYFTCKNDNGRAISTVNVDLDGYTTVEISRIDAFTCVFTKEQSSENIITENIPRSDCNIFMYLQVEDLAYEEIKTDFVAVGKAVENKPVINSIGNEVLSPSLLMQVGTVTVADCDLNDDCVVDDLDADILEAYYGENGELGWIPADINYDGVVNYIDASALVTHWNLTVPNCNQNVIYVDDDFDNKTNGWGVDHFSTISDGFFNCSSGGTIFVMNGVYPENIIMDKSVTIIGEDPKLTVIDGGEGSDVVEIIADYCSILNICIKNGAENHGVKIASDNAIISDCIIKNNKYGIWVESSKACLVANNSIFSNAGGIKLKTSSDIQVQGNVLSGNSLDGIALEDSVYCKITNNTLQKTGITISGSKACWNTHVIEDNLVRNKPILYFKDQIGTAISSDVSQVILANCSQFSITNSTFDDVLIGIQLGYSTYTVVWNCSFLQNQECSIRLYSSNVNDISNCIVEGGTGLDLHDSSNNKILDNTIHQTDIALNMFQSKANTIQGNTIEENDFALWMYTYCTDNDIIDNNLISNPRGGIWMMAGCCRNNISKNVIRSNGELSPQKTNMYMSGFCNNNIFTDNTISSDDMKGIHIIGCNDNIFYHNDFIGNQIHACDLGDNIWNLSVPIGGNYFDDYTGIDEDNDGFGDTPYHIFCGGNSDYLPLVNRAPNTPNAPSPANNSKDCDTTLDLSWNCTDLDDDILAFDIYLGTTPSPSVISTGQSELRFSVENLTFNTTYYWRILVKDVRGAQTLGPLWMFTTKNASSTCDFIYSPENPKTSDIITFADSSTSNGRHIIEHAWYVDESIIGNGKTISYEFPDSGLYTVTLRITDHYPTGSTIVCTKEIWIDNILPVSNFTFSITNPTQNCPITFTSTSSDEDGAISSWYWDFGDGHSSNQQHPTHQYQSDGTYSITHRVYDDKDAYDEITKRITVCTPNPSFSIQPTTPLIDQSITFIPIEPCDTVLTYLWDFGDGTSSTEKTPTHTYDDSRIYAVSLTMTFCGGSKNVTINVTISSPPPFTGEFEWKPTAPSAYQDVYFSSKAQNGFPDYNFLWDFGDGTTSTEKHPIHTFDTGETFDVTLVITDSKGQTVELTDQLTISCSPPDADFTFSPNQPSIDEMITFNDLSTDSDGSIQSYLWDFGDGSISTEKDPIHSFEDPGVYTINLTVIDDCGKTSYIEKVLVLYMGSEASFNPDHIDIKSNGKWISFTIDFSDKIDIDVESLLFNDDTISLYEFSNNPKKFKCKIDREDMILLCSLGDNEIVITGKTIDGVSFISKTTFELTGSLPNAIDDSASTPEDTMITIDVLQNDQNIFNLQNLEIDQPLHGICALTENNTIEYTPLLNYVGHDNFTYTITDITGSDSAVVSIDITEQNDPPTSRSKTILMNMNDELVFIDSSFDFYDIDGDQLQQIMIEKGPDRGILSYNEGSVEEHTLIPVEDIISGRLRYTPVLNCYGAPYTSFEFKVHDGKDLSIDSYIMIISVGSVDNPDAQPDDVVTEEDVSILIDVLSNDVVSDGHGLLHIDQVIILPVHGTIEIIDEKIRYDPAPNWFGIDSFKYKAADEIDLTDVATVTIQVNPVNDCPVAYADNYVVKSDSSLAVTKETGILSNDFDGDEDMVTSVLVTDVSNGTLYLGSDGAFSYEPYERFIGSDSFKYKAFDGGCQSNAVIVRLKVQPCYELVASVSGNGIIERSNMKSCFDECETVILTANPSEGWLFDRWSGDVSVEDQNDNPLSITMIKDTQITAHFSKDCVFEPDFTWISLGSSIQFIDQSLCCDESLSRWYWDFGDGTTSTEQHPTHSFSIVGEYNVTLNVSCGNISRTIDTRNIPNQPVSENPKNRTLWIDPDISKLSCIVSVPYNFPTPSIGSITIGKESYDSLSLPDTQSIGEPGQPNLPAKGVYILLPQNSEVSKITVTTSEIEQISGTYDIEPCGLPYKLDGPQEENIPQKNNQIYSSNQLFPGSLYTNMGTYSVRGYDVLVLMLHPIQYRPATEEIYYYHNMHVSIETKDADSKDSVIYRGLESDTSVIQSLVDNPDISIYYELPSTTSQSSSSVDVVIITKESLSESFISLKQFHESRGLSSMIYAVEDIYSEYSGVDNPEKIRNFIKDAYSTLGVEYVLLGGDYDVVPARLLWVQSWPGSTAYTTTMPSDLYYSCLDGSYNSDGDARWGEPTDGENGGDVDLIGDVYVGRACVDTEQDVYMFIEKTIGYAQNDEDYLRSALLVGEYLGFGGVAEYGGNMMDELVDMVYTNGYETQGIPSDQFEISTLYERDTDWSKTDILSEINSGIHLINHLGHSNYNYNMKLINSDIQKITNQQYSFIYSQGCNAGGFDNPTGSDCIAEQLTIKSNTAAFAGIWNARYGWGSGYSTDGPSQRYNREFWDAVFGEGIIELGKANQDSKEDNLHLIDQSCMRWCYYQLNLFGDPTLELHTGHDGDDSDDGTDIDHDETGNLIVTFYNEDGSVIGRDYNVKNNSLALVPIDTLQRYSNFSWYVTIENKGELTIGPLWWFTVEAYDWDINRDGRCDDIDIELLINRYNESGDPGWIRSDIVRDGRINVRDIATFTEHYGENYFIEFHVDYSLNTIEVIDILKPGLSWNDFTIEGSAIIESDSDTIQSGDKLTNCFDTITLTYLPVSTVEWTWDFEANKDVVEIQQKRQTSQQSQGSIHIGFLMEDTELNEDISQITDHYNEVGVPGWIPEDINVDGCINFDDICALFSKCSDENETGSEKSIMPSNEGYTDQEENETLHENQTTSGTNETYISNNSYYDNSTAGMEFSDTDETNEQDITPISDDCEIKTVRSVLIEDSSRSLISTNNDDIPEYIRNEETDDLIPVVYAPAEIRSVENNDENGYIKLTVGVKKAKWIYMEIEDKYPDLTNITIKTSDGRIITEDMIWRENGKIYVLDDPDVIYEVIYHSATPIISNEIHYQPCIVFSTQLIATTFLIVLISFGLYIAKRRKLLFFKDTSKLKKELSDYEIEGTDSKIYLDETETLLLKMIYLEDITAEKILERLWIPYERLEKMVGSLLERGYIKEIKHDEYELSKEGIKIIKHKIDEYFE